MGVISNTWSCPASNETPRALLCLVYCAGRALSCFLTILRTPSALLTRLAPAPCTLNSIPHSDTHVHTAMHRFIPMTPAQSGHARICVYAHTYAHTAKGCLDPPRTTLQFAHALHTATTTSAITPTKQICAASSAYQIPRYTCILHIRRPMHTHAIMPV